MLAVLSPAKSLDFETRLPTRKHSEPRLVDHSVGLIELMRGKSPADVASLMDISEDLATLNATRYAEFEPKHDRSNSRPALFAFAGDVYRGFDAHTLDARDITESQKTVRILSGLYGVLRPLDLIQPHRLEMGTRLETQRGSSLYDFWGPRITDCLKRDLDASPGANVLVNLASNEYFGSVDTKRLGIRVITPRFEDRGPGGEPRVVSFHAKRARGLMARWCVVNRVRSAGKLLEFTADGYELDEARSTKDQPIFVR